MDQAILSAISRALFHREALAHIMIMNANRNAKSVITVIPHPDATAEMALQYHEIILTAVRTIKKCIVDVEENESWERLKIRPVPLVRYMGKGTECLQKMQEQFDAENEGIVISTQAWWLVNPRTLRERGENREIATSSVLFFVNGSRVGQTLMQKGIRLAAVCYRVKTYMKERADTRCEYCCGWGHIENKCGSKPRCGYYSGHHRMSDHKCNVAGCTGM
jgi:hypothetical protein